MNWTKFQTYNDSPTKAFEVLCNQLFENWCKEEYKTSLSSFNVVNGSGGDGGVESYAIMADGKIVGLQAKWFPTSISSNQMSQIRSSICTAMKVRPHLDRYIVCVPRDIASMTAKGKNTEDKRWEEMKTATQKEFPSLAIDLWDEARLVTELQKDSSAGIYKFWFKNSEISEDNVYFSFSKSKESWLSAKYVPELNVFGEIDDYISVFLGHNKQRNVIKHTFENISALYSEYLSVADDLICVCGENDPKLLTTLTEAKDRFSAIRCQADRALVWLNNETIFGISLDESVFWTDIDSIVEKIKDSNERVHHYFHFYEVEKVLLKLARIDVQNAIRIISRANDRRSLLFLGEPGTGKTQGVAAETEKLLSDGYHVPMLIQARDIPAEFTWRNILISNLGLSNTWSEDEIWQALSSQSNRKRIHILDSAEQINVLPKVVIIVDGIDESSLHEKWKERIQETNAIVQKYPQIRFCFTSRPFVFNSGMEYTNIVNLGVSGDVPVYKLFESYIRAYNINSTNLGWLKYGLTNPLALKLFCDINKDDTISYNYRADISVTTLLQKKIDILEKEYCAQVNFGTTNNQYILKSIRLFAVAFSIEHRLERDKLIKSIATELSIDIMETNRLLRYLENYGILHLFCEQGTGYLTPNTYYYYPGIQGYFDYALSLILLNEYTHPKDIDFDKSKNLQKNTLYALAIISIQKYDYLIISNPTINTVADEWFCEELLFISLRHSKVQNAEKYKKRLLQMMSDGAETLMSVVNNIVLPLSRDIQHPLGSSLLDEFLSQFDYPAHRDILWSVPCFLNGSNEDKWCFTKELALNDDEYALSKDDVAEGCPEIYAWALSSVDNLQRKHYRNALMEWARSSPDEFYKLFLKFSFNNDPQIRSDIFSVLMCLLFEDENKSLIEVAAKWIIKNVLAPDKIEENRDIAIRYYSCAIVQKAISLGIVERESAEPFLPPYHAKSNYISLSEEALSGTRMGGYSAIDYDLARYVLIDHLTGRFSDYDRRVDKQYENLIVRIAEEQPSYSGISVEQLIISSAFAFIAQCGWNEEDFYSYNHAKKKAIGVDRAIDHSHRSATHGSQSAVMTICEKYVWQARNYISGFLADRLQYCEDREVAQVSDYGLLDDFIIPLQELSQIDPDNIPIDHPWHIPEKEVVILEREYNEKEDVINSVITSPCVDWDKWLFINNHERKYKVESDNLAALASFSNFYGPSGVETCLYISSVLIAADDIDKFLDILSLDTELANRISNPTDWMGGIQSYCYVTPKEVCWFSWKNRYDSRFVDDFPQLRIQSAVDNCCYNFQEYGDVSYDLPSAPIRGLLQISNSDGYQFYNNEKKVKAEYCITGEKCRTYQDYLLVDKEELQSKAEASGKNLLWFMRESRREDGRSKEKFGKFYADKDSCFAGFFRNGEFVTVEISSHKSQSK